MFIFVVDFNFKIMNKEKYFVPELSELYVGYEAYWIIDHIKELTEDNLIPVTFSAKKLCITLFPPLKWEQEHSDDFNPNLMSYRTKYLDSDDIISLGFESLMVLTEVNDIDKYEPGFTLNIDKDNFYDLYMLEDNKIRIVYKYYVNTLSQEWKVVYEGLCKSKNQLKTILSWIK